LLNVYKKGGLNMQILNSQIKIRRFIGLYLGFSGLFISIFLSEIEGASLNFSYTQIKDEVVTPHTKWAKPYALGSVKVLCIAPLYAQRETLELAQRMDLDYTCIPVPMWHTQFQLEVWEYLRGKLKEDYEVIILGGLKWTLLPQDIRQKIIVKVKEGCSFLFVDPQGLDRNLYETFEKGKTNQLDIYLFDSIPFKKLPAFSRFVYGSDLAKKYISESQLGKGKICFIRYGSGRNTYGNILYLTPAGESKFIHYDYYLSLIAKIILKLANKEPTDKIISIQPKGKEVRIVLTGSHENLGLLLRIRDGDGKVEKEIAGKVSLRGQTHTSLLLPYLPAGVHFLDLFLKGKEKIIDWSSTYLEIPSSWRMKVRLDKDFYLPGEKINGKVTVSPELKGKIKVILEDNWNRIISVQEFPAQAVTTFSFPSFTPLTILHKIRIELYENERLVMREEKLVTVRLKKEISDFFFVTWTKPEQPEYISNYPLKFLNENGVDSSIITHCEDKDLLRKIVMYNLSPYAHIHTFRTYQAIKGLIRKPCLCDPKYRKSMEESLTRKAKIVFPFVPLGYSLGDENFLSDPHADYDFCFSPYCLESLRAYLKKEYGSLEALNQEWDTSFSDWSDVKPLTLKEILKRKENFSPWIDHRLHMESVYADIHRFGREVIEKVDKDAYVGEEGIWREENSFTGIDNYKLGSVLKAVGGYDSTTIWRAFLPEDSLLWDWGPYPRSNIEVAYRYPWRVLLSGGNGIGFFCSIFRDIEPELSAFNPDFTLNQAFEAVVKSVHSIKNGIGRLILSCKPSYSPIGILHSQPNLHLTTILSRTTWFNYLKSRSAFEKLLNELWYYPDFLAHQQIKDGILRQGKYRCLILPSIISVSSVERKEIKKFVNQGGIVIADILPGLFDGHGKMVKENEIEELFGVKRKKWPSELETGISFKGREMPLNIAEELTITTGKPLLLSAKGRPVFIFNSYGKGKTLCLNLNISLLSYHKDNYLLGEQPPPFLLYWVG